MRVAHVTATSAEPVTARASIGPALAEDPRATSSVMLWEIPRASHDVSELRLKLFIAGDSPRARAAASDLARVCHDHLDGEPVIETIDVLLQPDLADAYAVLTTPTVVREFPPPRRRATGDLRDAARLLAALALRSTRLT
jgi:circadian clock protein KaiB